MDTTNSNDDEFLAPLTPKTGGSLESPKIQRSSSQMLNKVGGSLVKQVHVHQGSADIKFAALFNEGMKEFRRINQYGVHNAKEGFSLGSPSLLSGKYMVYLTTGIDTKGVPFQGNRRYNEFFHLREMLKHAWPGIYIPSIPSKKYVGNKDAKFIVERRYFLERFF